MENKILKYLIFLIVLGVLLISIKEIILKPKPLSIPEVFPITGKIEIDFESLETPELKEFLPFEKISFPEEIGRENPFEPY